MFWSQSTRREKAETLAGVALIAAAFVSRGYSNSFSIVLDLFLTVLSQAEVIIGVNLIFDAANTRSTRRGNY